VEEYLGEQIRNIVFEKWPCTWLTEDEPADQPADALQVAHYWIDIAARQGVRNRARIEGRTEQFIVRCKGYDIVDKYVLGLQDSIRIDDMPPAKIFSTETNNQINTGERASKWLPFWERIMAEFEFEFRIDNLPANPRPRIGLQGMIYAEF
jgi:hypothetical protein